MITEFLEELKAAADFEFLRIQGYREILSFPTDLLSDVGRIEVTQGYTWSTQRESVLITVIAALEMLVSEG